MPQRISSLQVNFDQPRSNPHVNLLLPLLAFWPFTCTTMYCHYVDVSKSGEKTAVAIVAGTSDGAAQRRSHPNAKWLVFGSIEFTSRDLETGFCPGEYVVFLGAAEDAPRWFVDIESKKVIRKESMAQLDNETKSVTPNPNFQPNVDDDRARLCMNGKPQVVLDPAEVPDRGIPDLSPHEPSTY